MAERREDTDAGVASIGAVRPVTAIVILFICLVVLRGRLEGVDLGLVAVHLHGISTAQWIAAVALTAGSFAAVGLYDDHIHRWLNTGITSRRAAISGAASIAVAQMVGLGLVTGTLARWRMMPDLPILTAARVTAAVSVSFMLALGVVITGALLIGLAPDPAPGWLVPAGVVSACALVLVSLIRPHRLPVSLPPLRMMSGILAATVIDTVLAGLAFYVLLPPELGFQAQLIIPAFLLALGAGLIGGAPAGAGAFELTLLLLLPMVPEPELLAAIVAFRVVYYVLPASFGAAVLLLRVTPTAPATREAPAHPDLLRTDRAEAGLARLGEFEVMALGETRILGADSGQALVALGDPLAGDTGSCLRELSDMAEHRGLIPAIYKCGAAVAIKARRAGWMCLRCADELWIDPTSFSLSTPRRRRLRRKLRAAATSGVTVEPVAGTPPLRAMADTAKEWADARGGERGFSMGRWDPDYVSGQRVYLARLEGQVVAFATFHDGADEWALDLIRFSAAMPDGTMHQIIVSAIEDAGRLGRTRLSLAALPPSSQPPLLRGLARRLGLTDGLRQFKASFAPRHQPRYLIAPGPLGLVIAAADILRRVYRPVPLRQTPQPAPEDASNMHGIQYLPE